MSCNNGEVIQLNRINGRRDIAGEMISEIDDSSREYPKWNREKRIKKKSSGFPGGAVVENLPANAGDTGSSPGLGRSHMPRSN